jgi:Flp pilus assembly protein TadG
MVESAVVATVFLLLVVSVAEFGRIGYAYNVVSFAAHRGARYAAVRGSTSGRPASAADIQAEVQAYVTALDNSQLTVATTWNPDNNPGSTVIVKVSYGFKTILIPMSSGLISLETTCRQYISQ